MAQPEKTLLLGQLQKGDVIEFTDQDKTYYGIYIDTDSVVYSDSYIVPVDALFLRRLYYKLFPNIVKLRNIQDVAKVKICKRSRLGNQLKIAERAVLEVGSLSRLNNLNFTEYCQHGTFLARWKEAWVAVY